MKASEIMERRNKIVALVLTKGYLSTEEACQLFQVSNETIRQDFVKLEKQHILKRSHGGASAFESNIVAPIAERQSDNFNYKYQIAKKALEYLPPGGGVVGMDIGSTVSLMADLMEDTSNYLVITSSHPVLQKIIRSKNRLYNLGGEYNPIDMAYQGEQTISSLKKLSLDVTFIGTSGVMNRGGICSRDFHDINIKQAFIQQSKKVIILTDSSKFTSTSLVEVAPWNQVDLIITDSRIPESIAEEMRTMAELVIV